MAKKPGNKSSILVELYNNKLLVTKVNRALDTGMSYSDIIDLCKEYDFEINKTALTRYRQKRKESIETGIPLEELLDKRKKSGNILDLQTRKSKKEEPTTGEVTYRDEDEFYADITGIDKNIKTQEKLYSDIEMLDQIIQKGMKGLEYVDIVEAPLAMKAIEIKDKITGNQLRGLSVAGLRELSVRRMAKESAMTEALLAYVPEDKHEEVLLYMNEKEKEFYDNLDLSEEDRKITQALKQANFDF